MNNDLPYLNELIGKKLNYAIKSPDMELCDFGFGEDEVWKVEDGSERMLPPYILHTLCGILLEVRGVGYKMIETYTDASVFSRVIRRFIGLKVQKTEIQENNDLMIVFENCRMTVITNCNSEESWRLFANNSPHLVASDTNLELQ